MSQRLEGVIEHQAIGPGVWALVTDQGETYELRKIPPELRQAGLRVSLTGTVQPDAMTIAMIGAVFQIDGFEIQ